VSVPSVRSGALPATSEKIQRSHGLNLLLQDGTCLQSTTHSELSTSDRGSYKHYPIIVLLYTSSFQLGRASPRLRSPSQPSPQRIVRKGGWIEPETTFGLRSGGYRRRYPHSNCLKTRTHTINSCFDIPTSLLSKCQANPSSKRLQVSPVQTTPSILRLLPLLSASSLINSPLHTHATAPHIQGSASPSPPASNPKCSSPTSAPSSPGSTSQ